MPQAGDCVGPCLAAQVQPQRVQALPVPADRQQVSAQPQIVQDLCQSGDCSVSRLLCRDCIPAAQALTAALLHVGQQPGRTIHKHPWSSQMGTLMD